MTLPVSIDSLIDQVAKGAFLKDLEAQAGVTRQRLSQILTQHPEYKLAKKSQLESRLDEAQGELDSASDALSLARAREKFRAAAWRAERECPGEWGNRTQISGTDGQPLQINNIAITFVQAEPSRSATIEHDEQPLTSNSLIDKKE